MNWGRLGKAVSAGASRGTLHPGDEDVCLLLDGEGTSHTWALGPASGEKGGEGQRELPAFAIFSNSFTLKYSTCQAAILWGTMF